MYAGMTQDVRVHEPVLKFVIFNGWTERISYFAKSAGTPYPELRLNGKKLPLSVFSATGMESYDIEPGASAEVRVYPAQFPERPKKGDYVTVGFYLAHETGGLHEPVATPAFILPLEFRQAIETMSK